MKTFCFYKIVILTVLITGSFNSYADNRFFTFERVALTDPLLTELCEEVIYPILKENNVNWENTVVSITEEKWEGEVYIEVNIERGLNVLSYYDLNRKDMDYGIVPINDMDVQIYLPKSYGLIRKIGGRQLVEDYHINDLLIVSDIRIYWLFKYVNGRYELDSINDYSESFLKKYSYQELLPPSLRKTHHIPSASSRIRTK